MDHFPSGAPTGWFPTANSAEPLHGATLRAICDGLTHTSNVVHRRVKRFEGLHNRTNIEGLNLLAMESALGYLRGQPLQGARVLVLLEQPSVGQFVFAGSTLTPNADDLYR